MMTKQQEIAFRVNYKNYDMWGNYRHYLLKHGSVDFIREMRHILVFDHYYEYKLVVQRKDLHKDFKKEIEKYYDTWGKYYKEDAWL